MDLPDGVRRDLYELVRSEAMRPVTVGRVGFLKITPASRDWLLAEGYIAPRVPTDRHAALLSGYRLTRAGGELAQSTFPEWWADTMDECARRGEETIERMEERAATREAQEADW
jgi:hypothetical protein